MNNNEPNKVTRYSLSDVEWVAGKAVKPAWAEPGAEWRTNGSEKVFQFQKFIISSWLNKTALATRAKLEKRTIVRWLEALP